MHCRKDAFRALSSSPMLFSSACLGCYSSSMQGEAWERRRNRKEKKRKYNRVGPVIEPYASHCFPLQLLPPCCTPALAVFELDGETGTPNASTPRHLVRWDSNNVDHNTGSTGAYAWKRLLPSSRHGVNLAGLMLD